MSIGRKEIAIWLTITGIILILLNAFSSCNNQSKETNSPYLNHHDSAQYVGIQTCRNCHAEIYNSFIQTGMGSSFGIATKSKSAADFSKHPVVYDKYNDLSYHPFWSSDSMYIMEYRLDGKDTVHKRIEKVSYIIGSGQHTNSHLAEINGFVYQLPLTWYAQKKKWDLPPGFENGRNVRFSREIGFECMSCHNALPQYVKESGNKFTSIPHGIDCERCHGPGSIHVNRKMSGERIDTATQIDYSIVNPRKLSADLQIDICQRCHLQGNAVLQNGKDYGDFKPGMKLSNFMDVFMPIYTGNKNEFIMASHAQRLHLSKCFLKGGGDGNKLTCITCHNPHVSVKVTGTQVFNNACAKCHSKSDCKEIPTVRMASADNCWGCHMPKSGTIDIPHVTVTDHRIQIPVKSELKQQMKKFAGLYCINNPIPTSTSLINAHLSYVEKFEGEIGSLDSVTLGLENLKEDESTNEIRIHLAYLKKDYLSIVKLSLGLDTMKINSAWTCYRIGQSYQNLEQFDKAEKWYKTAVNRAPQNLDFSNKLASVILQNRKINEAIALLKELLSLNPKQSETWTNLGFAYLLSQNYSSAMDCYNKAIALDPDMPQALINKAALCNLTGDKKQSVVLLKRILKRDPDNMYVKQLLNNL